MSTAQHTPEQVKMSYCVAAIPALGAINTSGHVNIGGGRTTTIPFVVNGLIGDIDEAYVASSAPTDDYIKSEYNNQSSPATFWTTGAWEDQDAVLPTFNIAWAYYANQLIQ